MSWFVECWPGWVAVAEGSTLVCEILRIEILPVARTATASGCSQVRVTHVSVFRVIGYLDGEGETQYEEIEVCAQCVPKHSHYPSRAQVPEWPSHALVGRVVEKQLVGG